jgi:eukaryotic-like serine/threonine-protein kinase
MKGVSDDPSLRPGDRISAYRIEALLGCGGMGWVFRARHVVDGNVVALKVLRDDQLAVDRAVDRMMREASILATVRHGGVPQLYECGLVGSERRPWIAMELVGGSSLGARIHTGALTATDVIDLVGNVAGVLAAAHDRGVTHRDLKPDNVFLTPGDPVYPVRVIDWGIAHNLSGARYTDINEAIGTPTYMAPEQAKGGAPAGHADVYGLGVVAYHALAGRPPFSGGTAVEILVQHMKRPVPALAPRCPHAPIALVELVERMLAKSVDTRPSALEICDTIEMLRPRDDEQRTSRCTSSGSFVFVDGIPGTVHDSSPVVSTRPTASLRPLRRDD